MKFNTILIGDGYWGKILKPKLEQLTNLIAVANSKTNIDDIIRNNVHIDCVFICTPTETHYELCKKFIMNGINIFCEKPFTGDINKAEELYHLADLHNVKIFVDNIFLYRSEIINYYVKNTSKFFKFVWYKNEERYKDNLINTLLYHDIYLLINLSDEKWSLKSVDISNDYLNLELFNDDKIATFNYVRNFTESKIKQVFIDGDTIDLSQPVNDPLYDIINNLSSSNLDFNNNKILTLKTLNLIRKIIKK